MDLSEAIGDEKRGARSIAAGAAVFLIAGIGVTGVGILRSDPAKAVSGACLAMTALTFVALIMVRRWITNTGAERHRLAEATTAAADERTKYVASLAALDAERARVRRDVSAAVARQRAMLQVEREKLQGELELQRHRIVTDAFQTGALMERGGLLREPEPASVTQLFPHRGQGAAVDSGVSHPS